MGTIKKHLLIRGRVQGVGFRHFTWKAARNLGIAGWVRNREDGQVETMIQGVNDRVDEMIDRLREGPASSSVDSIEFLDSAETLKAHSTFEIIS